jgi:hypothetical protein
MVKQQPEDPHESDRWEKAKADQKRADEDAKRRREHDDDTSRDDDS